MSEERDGSRERRITDDVGIVRQWASEAGVVPVRPSGTSWPSDEVALVPESEADEHRRLDWAGFDHVLGRTGNVVRSGATADEEPAVVSTDEVDPDSVRYVTEAGPGYEERTMEGKTYRPHERRAVGHPGSESGERGSGDPDRRSRSQPREATAPVAPDVDDVGKPIVDADGNEVGVVAAVDSGEGVVYADADAGITDRITAKLGWKTAEGADHALGPDRIRRVTDDRVELEEGAEPREEPDREPGGA